MDGIPVRDQGPIRIVGPFGGVPPVVGPGVPSNVYGAVFSELGLDDGHEDLPGSVSGEGRAQGVFGGVPVVGFRWGEEEVGVDVIQIVRGIVGSAAGLGNIGRV